MRWDDANHDRHSNWIAIETGFFITFLWQISVKIHKMLVIDAFITSAVTSTLAQPIVHSAHHADMLHFGVKWLGNCKLDQVVKFCYPIGVVGKNSGY